MNKKDRSDLKEQLMHAVFNNDKELANRLRKKIEDSQSSGKKDKEINIISIPFPDNDAPVAEIVDKMESNLGKDWWELELDTIKQMFFKKGIKLPNENLWDKISAIKSIMNSDAPFFDYLSFDNISGPLNGIKNNFESLTLPSPGMVVCTVKALDQLRPDRKKFFSDEVIEYIIQILLSYGIYAPPLNLYEIISKKMKESVSSEIYNLWSDIFKQYKEVFKNGRGSDEESIINIQASRLFKADKAGEKSYKKGVI